MTSLRRVRRKAVWGGAFAASAIAALLAGSSITAEASHPQAVTIEQHWELLAETRTGLAATTQIAIERGTLPGGTSKFNPQPTATFEVVGRHVNGGSNTSWRIDLVGSSTTLASMSFANTASSLQRKSVSVTWPSSTVELDEIAAVKVNATSGTFDLRKATITIRQQGTPTKTVARVPLGAKQVNTTNTAPQLLAVPAHYTHVPADTDPAPTISLRATGAGTVSIEPHVQLAKCGAPQPSDACPSPTAVTGSELDFTSNALTSKSSGALTLTSGARYVVQMWIVELPGSQTPEPNEPGLYSAELVIEQSTADAHGIACTTGYYTGLTTEVTLDSGTNGQSLSYPIAPPAITVPSATASWQYAAKRTSASGAVGVKFKQGTSTPGVDLVSISGYDFKDSSIPVPAATGDIESIGEVSGSGVGKASMSRLRVPMCLRDVVSPQISGFAITSNPVFSPNGDGVKDSASFSATLADATTSTWPGSYPLSYTYQVKTLSGVLKRTFPGTLASAGSTGTVVWDGTDTGGALVADGTYDLVLSATDAAGNLVTQVRQLIVDRTVPTIGSLSASEPHFSPGTASPKSTTTISGSFADANGPLDWRLAIKDGSGAEVQSWADSHPTTVAKVWDGRNYQSQIVDGPYTATLSATDAAGNTAAQSLSGIVIDRAAPQVASLSATVDPFSPNADGIKDSTSFTSAITEPYLQGWSLTIKRDSTTHRSLTGTSASVSEVWDGTGAGGAVVTHGTYTATLAATDLAGNVGTAARAVLVDLLAPANDASASLSAFSPNADGVKDSSTISGALHDDSGPLSYQISIRSAASELVRTFSGTGTSPSHVWDGRDEAAALVPDGPYTATLVATDTQGLSSSDAVSITVDTAAPTISGLAASEMAFSPNADAVKDSTTISASLADANALSGWSLGLRAPGGTIVRTIGGSGSGPSAVWNGRSDANQVVADAAYDAVLSATDVAGNTAAQTLAGIVLDTVAPAISGLVASPSPFSPNADGIRDSASIGAGIDQASAWSLVIRQGASPVRSFSGSGTAVARVWDGRNDSGQLVADAAYTAALSATDPAGNTAGASTGVVVDLTAPALGALSATNPAFSPNLDGAKDSTNLSASATDVSGLSWMLEILDASSQPVKTFTGAGSSIGALWDGSNAGGTTAPDGAYTALVTVSDDQGLASSASRVLLVDTVAPQIADLAVSEAVFSPNADGIKDTTTFSAGLSDANGAPTWTLAIRNGGGTLARSFSGAGTALSQVWDGKNASGQAVTEGAYAITAVAEDVAGNRTVGAVAVDVDTHAPEIHEVQVSFQAISPNGDGVKDSTSVSTRIDDLHPGEWTLEVRDSEDSTVLVVPGFGTDLELEWAGINQSGQPAEDGKHWLAVAAADAAGNVAVLNQDEAFIIVDTAPPEPIRLQPERNGNTVFQTPPLAARFKVNAGEAALDPTSISFVFAEDVFTAPGSVGYDPGTGWATMITPVPHLLSVGTSYVARLRVFDLAGNSFETDWQFRVISSPSYGSSRARIDVDGKPDTQIGVATRKWQFQPFLDLSTSAVQWPQSSAHPGWGTAITTVSLEGSRVLVDVGSGEVAWPVRPYGAGAEIEVARQLLFISDSYAAPDVETILYPVSHRLDPIALELPLPVVSARLILDVEADSRTPDLCADGTDTSGCSPDPIKVQITQEFADRVQSHIEDVTGGISETTVVSGVALKKVFDPLDPGGSYTAVNPLQEYQCPIFDENGDPICPIAGVRYEGLDVTNAVAEGGWEYFCSETNLCRGEDYPASSNDTPRKFKEFCVHPADGRDIPLYCPDECVGENSSGCSQGALVWAGSHGTRTGPSGLQHLRFSVGLTSDWGFEDADFDVLGLHFSTRWRTMGWQNPPASDVPGGIPHTGGTLPGVYPQSSDGLPEQWATDLVVDCYAAVEGKGLFRGQLRERSDQGGRRGAVVGAGLDMGRTLPPYRGYPQWREQRPCPEARPDTPNRTASVRTEGASLTVRIRNLPCVNYGSAAQCNEQHGFLQGSWVHLNRRVDLANTAFSLIPNALTEICFGGRRHLCNAVGLIITIFGSDAAYREEGDPPVKVRVPDAFTPIAM